VVVIRDGLMLKSPFATGFNKREQYTTRQWRVVMENECSGELWVVAARRRRQCCDGIYMAFGFLARIALYYTLCTDALGMLILYTSCSVQNTTVVCEYSVVMYCIE
jgi:hypothetical protein